MTDPCRTQSAAHALHAPRRVHATALVCLLSSALTLHAQTLTTGALEGRLQAVAAAEVQASSVRASVRLRDERGLERALPVDAAGEFRFDDLPPGRYTLLVLRQATALEAVPAQPSGKVPAPALVEELAVDITAGQTVRLVLRSPAGLPAAAAQSVTVRAAEAERPALLDSPLNAAVLPADLLALPLDGRRFQDFALLTPLTNLADDSSAPASDPANAASDALEPAPDDALSLDVAQTTALALPASQGSFSQDGATGTRGYDGAPLGGRAMPFNVPLEAVREFQVRVLGAGSPLGRDAAGSVNAVTRRAEDALHGSAFFLLRNSAADATDPFAIATRYNGGAPVSATVKPRDQREQFGGSLGRRVPLTANRVYAFGAAEAQRRSFPGISSPDNANFYTLTATQRALLGNRGVTPAAAARGLQFLDSLSGEVPRRSTTFAVTPRLDAVTSARSTLLVTYTGARHSAPFGLRDGAVIPRSRDAFATLDSTVDALQTAETVGLGTRWVLNLRALASRDLLAVQEASALANEPQTGPGGTVPQVTIDLGSAAAGGSFRLGTPAAGQRRRVPQERRAEFAISATFTSRAHSVTLHAAGGTMDTRVDTAAATSGAYQYSSRATNGRSGGLVDFLTDFTYSATSYPNGGCPSIYAAVHLFCFNSFTQGFGAGTSVRFHTGEAAAAVLDQWRLTPHLHVELGARYEYFRMPLPQHTNVALDTTFGNYGVTAFLPGDPGNLAPRLAIAYGLRDSTVVRVGYGVHFGRAAGRVLQQVLTGTAQPQSSYNLRITPTVSIDPACSSAGTNFGYPATYTCGYTGAAPRTSSATILSRRFQLPMTQDAEVTVEHQFGQAIVLSASYVAALGRELPNSVDVNVAPSVATATYAIQRTDGATAPGLRNGSAFTVPVYTSRISPSFGPVTLVLSNGNSAYQAGVVQVSRSAGAALTLHAAYTFSKALDNLRVTGSAADSDAQFDPHEPLYDRAVSNLDRRHKLSAYAVWAPSLHARSRLLRAAANGWTVSPILFATSGRPYSYLVEGGTQLPGGRESLNGSGGATYLPSVGRNTLRLPPIVSLDMRVAHTFAMRERARLRLSAEAFNLLNHRHIGSVTQRAFLVGDTVNGITPLIFQDASTIAAEGLTSKPFGTPATGGTDLSRERRVQAGLRWEW